jgi:hypothetical protein
MHQCCGSVLQRKKKTRGGQHIEHEREAIKLKRHSGGCVGGKRPPLICDHPHESILESRVGSQIIEE